MPTSAHRPCNRDLRDCDVVHDVLLELPAQAVVARSVRMPLGRLAEENVRAAQARDELLVALFGQVERRRSRRVLVPHPVEPALEPVDALRVAIGVLITVIPVVPIQDVQAAVRADFLRDGHEPGVVGGSESPARRRTM